MLQILPGLIPDILKGFRGIFPASWYEVNEVCQELTAQQQAENLAYLSLSKRVDQLTSVRAGAH